MISRPTELCSWKRVINFGFPNTKKKPNTSTCLSIIDLRLSNLFLMELIFRYEKMALLWFRILRNSGSANEFVGCSWVRWQISAKGFDFHKEFTNSLKLFAKKDEPLLLRYTLLLFRHDLSILLLSIKDKPLNVHRLWIFSLMLLRSSLKSWYLLIKLDMTTWGFLQSF